MRVGGGGGGGAIEGDVCGFFVVLVIVVIVVGVVYVDRGEKVRGGVFHGSSFHNLFVWAAGELVGSASH